MDAYRHITPIERGCIMTLFNQGHSPAAIATMLKRHRCTILRELKRNSAGESYDASKAQEKYDSRRKRCRRKRKLDDPELFALVKERFLKLHWSPEQGADSVPLAPRRPHARHQLRHYLPRYLRQAFQ